MVALSEVLKQFNRLRVRPSMFARAEIQELANVLVPGEKLTHVVFGWYDNGFALLTCTDHRMLLIDKKPFFLKLEEVRYDRISEVKFLNRLLDSSIILSYAGMSLEFKTWNQGQLRKLTTYIQQAITIISQQQWQINAPPLQRLNNDTPKLPAPAVAVQQETAYPEELMQAASIDLGLAKNPYASTQKYMRRRIPLLGFNSTQR